LYTAYPIDDTSFKYELSSYFPKDKSDYQLEFSVRNAIEADGGCAVKYTFPTEIDISELD
jgi:hypothetical protein